jgi:UMF1 family MFS transporter
MGGSGMAEGGAGAGNRRDIAFWCLYDWGNSAVPALITSFVFAPYFLAQVAPNAVEGQAAWGFAIAMSAVATSILSLLLGAFADRSGRRRIWLGLCSLVAVVAAFALWWAVPGSGGMTLALIALAVTNTGFELGYVFYNALLTVVARPESLGRVSGMGWAAGYLGSLGSLLLFYAVFVAPAVPPFGLDPAAQEHIRIVGPFAAAWFLIFALPLVLAGPRETPARDSAGTIIREGLADVLDTLKALPRMPSVAWFLVAHMAFIDGVNTLFYLGPLVASGVFGFTESESLLFGVTIYVAGGAGAVLFGWIDDRIGPRRVILITIVALTVVASVTAIIDDKPTFWVLAALLGAFFGPIQASSRSLMARLAPPGMEAKLFALYALAGRATSFLGPALVAWITLETQSQRSGMIVVAVLLVIGFVLMFPVREPPAAPRAR